MRSTSGCWTCRIRKKRCDENKPICQGCSVLNITCHYSHEKPEWMDGGPKQGEMVQQLKRKIKEQGHRRPGQPAHTFPNHDTTTISSTASNIGDLPQRSYREQYLSNPSSEISEEIPNLSEGAISGESSNGIKQPGCMLTHGRMAFGQADTVLHMFYLDSVLPFLFPFYRPSFVEGGKAWILEMMISSPVVRQATLCQSSYFFSIARGTLKGSIDWDTVLSQTQESFHVIRHALQVLLDLDVTEHVHGAVRIMTSIMIVHCFSNAISTFYDSQAHFNGALAVFKQILTATTESEHDKDSPNFESVMARLGSQTTVLPAESVTVLNAEQAAFRFSSGLLVFNDIVVSTIRQEQPRLYEHHPSLLGTVDTLCPPINLENVIGCQNWVLLQIGEIAVLDLWKRQCKSVGNLNMIELVQRATDIKDLLEFHLARVETCSSQTANENAVDMFSTACNLPKRKTQSSIVTQVWAHASLLYLSIVVSGWQPANVDVQHHVRRIIELLTHEISPPALLRTMVWPFCVAGCLAAPCQEKHFRALVGELQPALVFNTVRKALELMENVWNDRHIQDANHDLASCFRSGGNMVLLV